MSLTSLFLAGEKHWFEQSMQIVTYPPGKYVISMVSSI